jgi:hypothetical protein
MMATSHAVSGAVIALAIREPVLALPLAFVSHFVLDSLPHIGLDEYGGHSKKPALFLKILIIDSLLLTGLMIFLIMQSAPIIVFGCLILAGSPDLIWAYRYTIQEKFGKAKERRKSRFSQFHSKIQWSQTLRGSFFEIPFTLLMTIFVIMNV